MHLLRPEAKYPAVGKSLIVKKEQGEQDKDPVELPNGEAELLSLVHDPETIITDSLVKRCY
ncbi:hypothetical protein LFE_0883 [Leptospirillum ferrooxidans C2-3]|uniref:Uncharacterized protein n=1 Tax=Leptospirillum ferrooxidans (strain C2-3) TaxID=1162668 RepID=I0IMT8_LEPFC|nr:hypothetical protein LFE_0883 [Leptospirillum ferrooxidans C2-3]